MGSHNEEAKARFEKEEADDLFEIGFEDESWQEERTNPTLQTMREGMRKERGQQAKIEHADREARVGRGYFSLVMASNIVAGVTESAPLRTSLPSYLIWARATSARKQDWLVSGGLTRPKDDFAIPVRQVHWKGNSFVYLSDFIEWAIEAKCTVVPKAAKEAEKECEVSDTFRHRVRLWEIDRTRAELRSAKAETLESILARDDRLAALDREWGEIIAFFQGADLATKRAETPAANARGGADGSVDEPSPEIDRETIAPNTDSPGRREQQVKVILETATKLGYDPLAIPFGGKAEIKTQCEEDEALFESTSFEHAWKAARRRNLVTVVNTHKYAKRG